MIYSGEAITAQAIDNGIVELNFDLKGESINKFNATTLHELRDAVEKIAADSSVKGLIFTSNKDCFIVGADITEFTNMFSKPDEELEAMILEVNKGFSAIEDLPFPTVAVINGLALGGGFEVCLSCDYRVMSNKAKVGLPEVKLGIYPGWGGTVRLPRLIGADNAIEWICTGNEKKPEAALKDGAVDVVVDHDKIKEAAIDLINKCNAGDFDYKARRAEKTGKMHLNTMESMMVFETAKGFVKGKAGPHYPSPVEAIKAMQKHATAERDKALEIEAKGFVKMAKTDVAQNLIGLFLNDQYLKKKAKDHEHLAKDVKSAAVLGAGIMGGGIAYQSAYKGTPIIMKDINEDAIQIGLDEAAKLLAKRVESGRMSEKQMADVLNSIRPTLSYGDFGNTDIIVEAVVENPNIKKSVLAEVEDAVSENTVIASNTSTISITSLATALKRPENFCGMHFFNPVHKMPLVEVIRGEKTSDATVATTVEYAKKMGKTPIVVNDCPGFLVNRILFPYFGGFTGLVHHGADFKRIDKLMTGFGWPMGPAYLLDVVGIDTAHHAGAVMADGFPDRMKYDMKTAIDVMFESERFGQKNNKGFFVYETDRKGKPKKVDDPEVYNMLKPVIGEQREFTDEEIIERMMVPLCIETVRCLEDNIVASPAEADMGLIFGIGFPPFRGGALRYIDSIGLAEFCAIADKYNELGPLYQPTEKMREMAKNGETFFK